MGKLIIEDTRGRRTSVPLKKGTLTVGRQENSTIRLNEKNVSRRHLELKWQKDGYYVIDSSRYGSMLNDQRFSGRARLYNGDELMVGEYKLILELEDECPIPRPHVPEADIDFGVARLVRLERGIPAQTWRIVGPTHIGSGRDANIRIHAANVLTRQCTLKPDGDGWKLEVSHPATTVNINGKATQRRILQRGDRIRLGDETFRWIPEVVLGVSVGPQDVDTEKQRPSWHRWKTVGLLADAL